MNYLQIVLSSIFAVIVLFLLSKLIGARQISQMSMFDYINGITIGSIAAEAAISKGQDVFGADGRNDHFRSGYTSSLCSCG